MKNLLLGAALAALALGLGSCRDDQREASRLDRPGAVDLDRVQSESREALSSAQGTPQAPARDLTEEPRVGSYNAPNTEVSRGEYDDSTYLGDHGDDLYSPHATGKLGDVEEGRGQGHQLPDLSAENVEPYPGVQPYPSGTMAGEYSGDEPWMNSEQEQANTELEEVRYNEKDAKLDYQVTRAFVGKKQLSSHKDIDINVSEGVVTLTGTVSSEDMKRSAEKVAKGVSGVREVRNEITVGQAAQGGQAGAPAGGQTGTQTDANIKVSDSELIGAVNSALGDKSSIKTSVKNGVVTLKGEVESYARAAEILDSLRDVQGIREVKSELKVNEQAQGTQGTQGAAPNSTGSQGGMNQGSQGGSNLGAGSTGGGQDAGMNPNSTGGTNQGTGSQGGSQGGQGTQR